MDVKESILQQLRKWHVRIRAIHKGHYKDAARISKNQHNLGLWVVIITTIVGTSVFASLATDKPDTWMKLVAGLISLIAAILAALQTYLNYPMKQLTHIIAATKLSSLKKKIEEQLTVGGTDDELKVFLHDVRTKWDAITDGAPLMSEETYNNTAKEMVTDLEFELPSEPSKN